MDLEKLLEQLTKLESSVKGLLESPPQDGVSTSRIGEEAAALPNASDPSAGSNWQMSGTGFSGSEGTSHFGRASSISGLLIPTRDDLESVTALNVGGWDDPQMPRHVLEQLSPFFIAGLLLQRRAWRGVNQWCLTAAVKGDQAFQWPPDQQLDFSSVVVQLKADEVRRSPAAKFMSLLPKEIHFPSRDTHAYLFVPTSETAYIWFSSTPQLWSENEMRHTLKLINRAFNP